MCEVRARLKIGPDGPTGFELQVGEQRVPFGFDEAWELVDQWPEWLGLVAAQQAASGGRIQLTLGGHAVRLDAYEARQLAGVPRQLRWLFTMVDRMPRCGHVQQHGQGRMS